MLTQRAVLLAKPEGTYAVDPTPTPGANALLVENLSWDFVNSRFHKRNPVRVSQGKFKQLYAGTLIEIKFEVEVKGSGVAGTAPELGPLLRACGLGETIVAATSVTYKPAPAGAPSLYMYFYSDGKLLKAAGSLGKVSGNIGVAAAPKYSFTFLAHFVSETDVALPGGVVFNATLPIPAIGVPFVMDALGTFAFSKMDFDLGNTIAMPDNMVAADGYGQLVITDRDPSASIDPEDVLVATYNFVNKWQTNAAFSLSTGLIGAVAGNRLQMTFPAASILEQSRGDKSGIITRPLKLELAETVAGDDDVQIIFT